MIHRPMDFEDGLKALLSLHPLERICFLDIPSVHQPHLTANLWYKLADCGINPEKSMIGEYIPPASVSHYQFCDRTESLSLPSSYSAVLVLDISIETSRTLAAAVRALEERGVTGDNIWFFPGSINFGPPRGFTLDRAQTYLDYARSFNE